MYEEIQYPPTRREDVSDELYGVSVADPYRWLEDGEGPEVQEWARAQNAVTSAFLGRIAVRDAIHARLSGLLQTGTIGRPVVQGNRYFHLRRAGSQNQPILYWREGTAGEDHILVDPAAYETDAASALDWWYPSPDGTLLACGISRGGDEKSTLSVRVVSTGEDLSDSIPYTRYASVAWTPDSSGFYYTRYPEPGTVPEGDENYFRKVFFHALGEDWRSDEQVFGTGLTREQSVWTDLSPDGRWLLVGTTEGWSKTEVFLKDLSQADSDFETVVAGSNALYVPDLQNDAIYLRTNEDAPRYRVFRADPHSPAREKWQEIVPEGPDVLRGHGLVAGCLACEYLQNASSRLKLFTPEGLPIREVGLPAVGTLNGWGGPPDGEELFFSFLTFTTPPTVFRHSTASGETEIWGKLAADLDSSAFEVRQVWYPSRDGTQVSLFLVHRKGLVLDGCRPTLLYGYGGFQVALTPAFLRGALLLLERGGVYAMANLRGGGEYGEAWHQGGMLANKQNCFDDFLGAAEYLIASGVTRPEALAIQGGSNGGLLVGAAVTQRPDLFRAAVCQVPLLDMIRYHRFRIARLWVPEYGSSEDPEQFRVLLSYSPYHHIRAGARYPAVLITAAESDTRVDPLHARKFAAGLQAAGSSLEHPNPVLLRIESRAGHGAGKPLSKVIDELTDVWSFLLNELCPEGTGGEPGPA